MSDNPANESRKREEGPLYESPYALWWPVFPVRVSNDPEEIRAARNETLRYAKDPAGVGEFELNPSWASPETPPEEVSLDEMALMSGGYVIPTDTKPLREYDPFEERPRLLDRVVELDLKGNPDAYGETLGFIEEYGFLGSPSLPRDDSWRFGEPLSVATNQLRDLQRLSQTWRKARDVPYRDLPDKDPHYEFDESAIDKLAITEMIVQVNNMLRDGAFPTLRFAPSELGRMRFTTGFTCQTLLHALYLQLFTDIAGSREYVRCPGCEILFGQERPNQLYCTPSCGGAHRQKKYRDRKRREKWS